MSTTANGNNRYLFVITGFDQEPDHTAAPLVLANSALAGGGDVLIWLTHNGAELAKKGGADNARSISFPSLNELLASYIEGGGKIGVCPPCGKTHGVTEQNMIASAGWMGAAALLSEMQGRQTLSF